MAIEEIKAEVSHQQKCADLKYFQIDITDQKTIEMFQTHLIKTHGGLDILINNAGIAFTVRKINR